MPGRRHAQGTHRVEVLGPTRVIVDGTEGRLSPQARRIVSLFAFTGGIVRVDSVAESLWGERPPATHRKVIHNRVAELRRIHPDLIRSDDDGYALGEDLVLDCVELEVALEEATRLLAAGDPVTALGVTRRASGLWRGTPFFDLDQAAVHSRRVALEECAHLLTERRAEALLRSGDAAGAAVVLETLVASTPLVERRWWLLMAALNAAGHRSEALRAFQRARKVLREETGLAPGQGLVQLEGEILAGATIELDRPSPGPSTAGALAWERRPSRTGGATGLPRYATPFIGRSAELRAVRSRLRGERVITIIGPPGVGKTRLAVEALADPRLDRPVVFVPLAPHGDPEQVVVTVAAACGVGVDTAEDRAAAFAAGLGGKATVIVIDTCEHVVDAVRDLVETSAGPPATFILTSRVRLGIRGERVIEVLPLETGDAGRPGPALELFESLVPDELLDHSDLEHAVRIVARLDGLPLAIEMAAAQLRWTGLDELDAMVAERVTALDLSPRRGGDSRHLTLEQALDWSYDLLDPESQRVLRALSVFHGGFRVDAAAAVADAEPLGITSVVRSLVDRSLVIVDRRGPARYRLLDSVREFAGGKLTRSGERAGAEERHLRWCEELAEAARRGLYSPEEASWVAMADVETPNVIAAARGAQRGGEPGRAAGLIGSFMALAIVQTRVSVFAGAASLVDDLLSPSAGSPAPGTGSTLAMAAWAALRRSDLHLAGDLAGRAIAVAVDDAERSECVPVAAAVAAFGGDLARMRELTVVGETAARRAGHLPGVALNSGLRVMFDNPSDLEASRESAEACLAASLEVGSPSFGGWGHYVMGVHLLDGDPSRAHEHLQLALRLLEPVGARFYTDLVLRSLGDLHATRSPVEGVQELVMAVRSQLAIGDVNQAFMTASWLSRPLVALGFHHEAVMVESMVSTGGDPIAVELFGRERAAALAAARSALGPIAYTRASELGATSTLSDVIERIGELDLTEGQ